MAGKHTFTYEVLNKASDKPEIKIYGYIGTWDEVDYKRFQATFRELLKDSQELTMRIHCGGGSVLEGLAIYDLLRGSECTIHVIVEGMAASMGSVLALAGDKIEMTENAFFMMHEVSTGAWGGKSAIESALKLRDQAQERIEKIYKERTTASEETINDWFTNGKDNWLDAEECLKIKLCDGIIKPTKKRKLENVALTNKTAAEAWETISGALIEKEQKSETKNQNMKKQLVSMLLAAGLFQELTANSDDKDVANAFESVLADAKKANGYKTELENMKKENATALVEAAIKSGKVFANEKEEWIKNATENFAMTSKVLERMAGKPDPNATVKRQAPKAETDPDQPEVMNGREEWDFDKWQKEDPKGLAKLEDENPEVFEGLFNKKYNK